jgi:RHH-type proline utilization regulon transcriptional repressor/proline dehydrogenase/delta 1-pyrroline-5-carboxylate dehydrogenase
MSGQATDLSKLYQLTQTEMNGWKILAPQEYLHFIQDHRADFALELARFDKIQSDYPYRRDVTLYGFPMLCRVDKATKSLSIASRRLSRELYLLKVLESEGKTYPELTQFAASFAQLDSRHFPTEWKVVTDTLSLADWNQDWSEVEERMKSHLGRLVGFVQTYRSTLFERVSDWGLSLTAQYALLRIHLLKFLALLPSLDHDKKGFEVKKNLIESFRRLRDDNRLIRSKGVKSLGQKALPRKYMLLVKLGQDVFKILPAGLLAVIVRFMVKMMAKRFIAGESIASSDTTLHALARTNREATLDQLGELVVSQKEAEEYVAKVLAIINGLKVHIKPGERNGAGIPKAHVSIKVSALAHDFKPQAFDYTYSLVAPRLKRILLAAAHEQVFVNIDAEHYHYRDLVLKIYRKVLLETESLKSWADTGIVIQAYLRDAALHFKDVISLARERGQRMPIRLVKGAYWDAETIESEVHSHHAPQFLNKEETDLHFRQIAYMALEHGDVIQLAVGSHNLQDHCFVEALREKKFPTAPVIEHQCLHMTYEALSHGLSKMGWPVRNYMPIGNLLVGMAYLVRRIMENSSQVGILTIMRSHNHALANKTPIQSHRERIEKAEVSRDAIEERLDPSFKNATPARLYLEADLRQLEAALNKLEAQIQSQQAEFKTQSGLKIHCGSKPELIVGVIPENTAADGMIMARELYTEMQKPESWAHAPLSHKAAVILKAADLMWARRFELSALIVLESSKAWTEALADVDEAIDFLNFYIREEFNHKDTAPRGVTLAIAPWNFPLAIACGLMSAPLIAGNHVILKPAEQTPLIAQKLIDLMLEAGVPKEALRVLHGDGKDVAAPLVESDWVNTIVFTGSKAVGQWIHQKAALKLTRSPLDGADIPKKVIAEMGGKNAIIVTNNCEQDETISGILYGAFGHAGQKCSACSRVIVDREIKASLVERLSQAIGDLKVGAATDPQVFVNPLVTQADQERVREIVKLAVQEAQEHGGKVWVNRSQEQTAGFSVGPVLIELPSDRALDPDSWAQKEIFGPVIHLISYVDLDHAAELFNSTEYALTGAIYGQSQDDIDYLLSKLECGNLYINRPNTGARVAIEPFGGFKLSGTGPKAGGVHYMKEFHVHSMSPLTQKASWGKDTGFSFKVPQKSHLSVKGRLARWEKWMEKVLTHYERLTGRLSEQEKEILSDLYHWGLKESEAFFEREHSNLRTPGQLNFNKFDLSRPNLVIAVQEPKIAFNALVRASLALLSGNGLAIACCSDESYGGWRELAQTAHNCGFSGLNFELYKVGKAEFHSLAQHPKLSALHLSGNLSFYELEEFKPEAQTIYLKHFSHDLDHPSLKASWPQWMESHVYTRALAINTMRHGAPLEIEL